MWSRNTVQRFLFNYEIHKWLETARERTPVLGPNQSPMIGVICWRSDYGTKSLFLTTNEIWFVSDCESEGMFETNGKATKSSVSNFIASESANTSRRNKKWFLVLVLSWSLSILVICAVTKNRTREITRSRVRSDWAIEMVAQYYCVKSVITRAVCTERSIRATRCVYAHHRRSHHHHIIFNIRIIKVKHQRLQNIWNNVKVLQ